MEKIKTFNLENSFAARLSIVMCLFVYAGSFFFPLLDKDAAHHANIALHMYEHNDYISLIDRDNDYLDKPHLLFWVSAISFKIFGVTTFAHRFPAFLFSLLSLYSTFRLCRNLAGKTTAWMAMLILATAQSFLLSVIDARMEAPLTAFIIFGIWQMVEYTEKRKFFNLVLAALGTALAFSTKGWLGPVIIFITMFFYWLTKKNWSWIREYKTWLFIPLFFIFISPVLYAYYVQYDLHPEKIIRGKSGNSGVRFILWNQLFERAGGFDVKERNGDYFFLYHTFLWAFFPWSLVGYVALVYWIGRFFRKENNPLLFAALSFAFVLFTISFSRFKMPHYIIMLLPLAALFTAPYLLKVLFERKGRKWIYPSHMVFAIIVLVLTIALNFYFFKPVNAVMWIAGISALLFFVWILVRKFTGRSEKTIWITIGLSLVFNFFLNYNFFPNLMHYQGGNELVKMMREQKSEIPDSSIFLLELNAHSFDFYRAHNHRTLDAGSFESVYPQFADKYFLTSSFISNFLREKGFTIQPVFSHVDYNVAIMKYKFLNPATRSAALDSLMLVKIYR